MLPTTIEDLAVSLDEQNYFSANDLTVAIHLALQLGRPLFLEGEAGVGKTEVAKVLARISDDELIRLQCYEGLDVGQALYEWDYARQMMEIRLLEARGEGQHATAKDIMSRDFLIARPLLQAIEATTDGHRPVLLIDELDRADEEFEAFLLELLSDFQVSIPEIGTVKAEVPPIVVLTSNRTREIHDALKRRCIYHWIDYPDFDRNRRIPGSVARRCHGAAPSHGPLQAARCRRDTRLGRIAPAPPRRGAIAETHRQHSRSGPQVQRRHRHRERGWRRRSGCRDMRLSP